MRVIECFTTRYALPSITLWRRASELWSRDQRIGESVDAFYADMQSRVREVDAPADMTGYAMLKGLRPELPVSYTHLTLPTKRIV